MAKKQLSNEEVLKKELFDLFRHIQKIRTEIAAIHVPDDPFEDVSDQLDAIVSATESATNDIMENVEEISDIAMDLSGDLDGNDKAVEKCNKIAENASNVIVACSFQDITGQRVTKVVKSTKHIEERIRALVSMWGEEEIFKQDVDIDDGSQDEYQKYLHGPALDGQGLEQNDVDAILSGVAKKPPMKEEPKAKKAKPKKKAKNKKQSEKKEKASKSEVATDAQEDAGPALDQGAIDALFD